MDEYRTAVVGILPVAAVLAVLLLTWLGAAVFGAHAHHQAPPAGRGRAVPRQRDERAQRPANRAS